jgi:MoaA/NifB/PqqE/SkfB family radical SAM enzyme
MRHLEKIYLEITNECNLSCAFCPAPSRPGEFMDVARFSLVMERIRGVADTLYFHLKGEPLLHPELPRLLDIADDAGFPVIITTNGTLLPGLVPALEGKRNLVRINVSLQSLSCFPAGERRERIDSILGAVDRLTAARRAGQAPGLGSGTLPTARQSFLASLRLWTRDSAADTAFACRAIEDYYSLAPESVSGALLSPAASRKNGAVIKPGIAIHAADTFEWPSLSAPDYGARGFCRGLRDQAGILVDGTVVPCCLDGDGVLDLGNIFDSSWAEIMESPRARAIYKAFSDRIIEEPLCRHCGYRTRFGS